MSTRILRGTTEQDIAVTITAPAGHHQRPPLSVAVVIDRSGSMNGTPIANAKAAAAKLVDELGPEDAFTIVTYSNEDELIVPIERATAANKEAAHAAIAAIYDDGATCISCGLTRGSNELAHSPVTGGLKRIVLISDGQANTGVWDRGELAQLASDTATHGVSISSVGVGLDFDELTMMKLAEVGRGNYYFVEDTANLDAMFAKELGGHAETVAADVHLVANTTNGTTIDRAYGYPMSSVASQTNLIPIADLRAGETRKVVLHMRVPYAQTLGRLDLASFELTWRQPDDGSVHVANADLLTEVVGDAADVSAKIDRAAVQAIEEARGAQFLEDATITYEQQGAKAAQQVIEHHMRAVRDNPTLDRSTEMKIEKASNEAIEGFAAAPAGNGEKAKKATRANAYELMH